MSLVSFGLRLVVSRLLRGQTWAGNRIYNSPIDPLAEWENGVEIGQRQPCIAIYTGQREATVVGKATQGKLATIDLVFDIFVPPTLVVAAPADGETPAITLETSNTGGAMVIDLMARQIDAAFKFGPEPWKSIWDIFVVSVRSVRSRPLLYEVDKTVQIPCVEITYSLECIPDPDFGVDLLPGWAMLKAAMLADPDYAASASLLDTLISGPQGLPDWRKAQAALGLSDAAIRSLGVVDESEDGDPALLETIVLTETPELS